MPRWELHGLVVEARCEAGVDPAAALLRLLPPAPASGPAGLTIETVVEACPPPSGPAVFSLLGAELWLAPDGLVVTGAGATLSLTGGRLRVAVPAPLGEAGALRLAQVPLLVALLAFLRGRGCYHLHAGAAVAPGGRTLLVAGATGSGKSTLTAALVAAGCGYLGDDVVLVGAGPRLLAFPRPFHLSDEAAAAVVPPAPGAGPVEGPGPRSLKGKLALDPRVLFPGREQLVGPAPAVLVFPRVEDRAVTTLRPVSRADALGRLVESSVFVAVRGLPGTREHLALLGAVADGARALEAALGRDLLEDAARTAGRVLGEALP